MMPMPVEITENKPYEWLFKAMDSRWILNGKKTVNGFSAGFGTIMWAMRSQTAMYYNCGAVRILVGSGHHTCAGLHM
jgi:hypothetical protein